MVVVDGEKCCRCNACMLDCPLELLRPGRDRVPAMPPELAGKCLNCQHCLAVCPAGALTCNGVTPEMCAPAGPLPSPEAMLNLLRQRRSIRRFRPEPVAPEILAGLKSALAWSPTGCNDHRTLFHLTEQPEETAFFREETMKLVRKLTKFGLLRLLPRYRRFLQAISLGEDVIWRGAPHILVAASPKEAPCAAADPWIALAELELYAWSLGLGTCWCGFGSYAIRFNRALREQLAFPRGCRVWAVLLLGYPAVTYRRATCPPPVFR